MTGSEKQDSVDSSARHPVTSDARKDLRGLSQGPHSLEKSTAHCDEGDRGGMSVSRDGKRHRRMAGKIVRTEHQGLCCEIVLYV